MAAAAADSSMQGPSPIPAAWAETKPTDEVQGGRTQGHARSGEEEHLTSTTTACQPTKKQWDELMARCKEKAPVLLAAAQSEENLKSIGHKNGVDMWTAKTEESKGEAVASHCSTRTRGGAGNDAARTIRDT